MKKSIKAMSVFMSAMLTLGSLGAVSLTAGAQESIGTVTKITSGDFVYTVEAMSLPLWITQARQTHL